MAGRQRQLQAGGQTQAIAYGNYQIGGGVRGQSIYFIDGVKSNITRIMSTLWFRRKMQWALTNNVSAELGGFAGGVVQISTKSGSNDFHGNAYEYFRNTALDADDWFSDPYWPGQVASPPKSIQHNLGGPIWKNKAFFLFSWEHRVALSQQVQSMRPSLSLPS